MKSVVVYKFGRLRDVDSSHALAVAPPAGAGAGEVTLTLSGRGKARMTVTGGQDGPQQAALGVILKRHLPPGQVAQVSIETDDGVEDLELTVEFQTGARDGSAPLADGQTVNTSADQTYTYTLADGQTATVTIQGGTV